MSTLIYDLNSLTSGSPIVVCLKIQIPGQSPVYVTSNNEDVVFNGNTYKSAYFQITELSHGLDGDVPEISIQLSNIARTVESLLHNYDAYLKEHGIEGNYVTAEMYIVNLKVPDTSLLTEYLTFKSASADAEWATLKLGASSVFDMRYPRRRLLKNFCSWKFKSTKCGYTGLRQSCNKTTTACRNRGNLARFGGFPGITAGVRV